MSPLIEDGAALEIKPRRYYWPGDVVVLRVGDGGLRVHRVLGYRPRRGHLELITQGDHATSHDLPVQRCEIIGRVRGGQCSPAVIDVPFRHRLWALGRFLILLARRMIGRRPARD